MGITTKILNYFHCLCLLSLSLMNSRGKATSQALRFCFISGKNFPVDQRSPLVSPNWQWLRTGPVCRNYSASNGTTAVHFLLWVCPLHLPIHIVIASPLSSLPPTDSNPRPPAPHPPPKPSAVDGCNAHKVISIPQTLSCHFLGKISTQLLFHTNYS